MKLATIRTAEGTRAVRLDGDQQVDLGYASLGELLAEEDWGSRAVSTGSTAYPVAAADFAPVVPQPTIVIGKTVRRTDEEQNANTSDLILTGTNGGVGHARNPQEFLWGGGRVDITVDGIGTLTNTIVKG